MWPNISRKDLDMKHTPYGYDIVGGKAVINEDEAANVRKICENYLKGMSFVKAAASVGLNMRHRTVKQIVQNRRLLGDDFYPAILSENTATLIEKERIRRVKAMGRDKRIYKKNEAVKVKTDFTVPKVPVKYQNPIKQAEYAYSLIQSEVDR